MCISMNKWQHPTAPQSPFKEVAPRSNLQEEKKEWHLFLWYFESFRRCTDMERKREKSVDGISNLVESVLIWRGAARLTQPPSPSNCSAQPLSTHLSGGWAIYIYWMFVQCKREFKSHQLDWLGPNWEAGVKEMAWEGWRRRLKARTRIHGTEVIPGPSLLVICVPGQPCWIYLDGSLASNCQVSVSWTLVTGQCTWETKIMY